MLLTRALFWFDLSDSGWKGIRMKWEWPERYYYEVVFIESHCPVHLLDTGQSKQSMQLSSTIACIFHRHSHALFAAPVTLLISLNVFNKTYQHTWVLVISCGGHSFQQKKKGGVDLLLLLFCIIRQKRDYCLPKHPTCGMQLLASVHSRRGATMRNAGTPKPRFPRWVS